MRSTCSGHEGIAARPGCPAWDRRRLFGLFGAGAAGLLAGASLSGQRALAAGGTTLRDFASAEGRPGHFGRQCAAYGRAREPSRACSTPIRAVRQGQRAPY